jgi:hypothetical protein
VTFFRLSLPFPVTFFVVFFGFFMVIFSAKAFNQTRAWGRQAVAPGAIREIRPPYPGVPRKSTGPKNLS